MQERIAECPNVVEQLERQVLVHAASAEIIGVHAAAGGALVKYHQLLALLKTPQRRRERADIHRLRGDVEEMRQEPPDLAIEHADQLGAPGDGQAEQLLGRQAERHDIKPFILRSGVSNQKLEVGEDPAINIGPLFERNLRHPRIKAVQSRVVAEKGVGVP